MVDIEVRSTDNLMELMGDPDAQQQVKNQVVDAWNKGKASRRDKEANWIKCWRMYSQYINQSLYKQQPWRSKLPIAWSYNAVTRSVNKWSGLIFPNKEDYFKIFPVNSDDDLEELNARLMDKWLRFRLEQMDFIETFKKGLTEAAIIGQAVFKVTWRTETQELPLSVEGQLQTSTRTLYNGPIVEHILMDDFVIYPAVTNIDRAMVVHRIVKHISEVKKNPIYVNTEKLHTTNPSTSSEMVDSIRWKVNSAFGITDDRAEDQVVELLEAWGDFTINGKVYRNLVATVANGTVLLRLQPNTIPSGRKPFVFFPLKEIPGQSYGYGILEPAIGVHSMAMTIQNMMLDEMKLKIHQPMKYEPDGVFDPNNYIKGPNSLVAVGDINNLRPVQEQMHQMVLGFDMLTYLKGEFEEATGVSKFTTGVEKVSKARTAREAMRIAQAEDDNVMQTTLNISERALRPLLLLVYELVSLIDPIEEIASYSNVDPQIAQQLSMLGLPLGETDIKVTGVQTAIVKARKIDKIENFARLASGTPYAGVLNWAEIHEDWARALDIQAPERYLPPQQFRDLFYQIQLSQVMGIPPEFMIQGVANGLSQ